MFVNMWLKCKIYNALLYTYHCHIYELTIFKMANDNSRLLIPLSSPHLATVLLTPNKV